MPKFTAADVSALMTDLTKVRNIMVCGGIGQGKTTLLDNFGAQCGLCAEDAIGATLFAHARADEREKGCTFKSNVSSLVINEMLFHVLDTPGHAEYSAEFQTCLPMADGAIVVADGSGGGMSIQASRQLSDLVAWGIEPILVCNRFDVSLFTTKKSGEEISYDVMQVVEQFNAALDTAVSVLGPAPVATPETGRVIFGSLLQGWAFTIPQLAQLYAAKFGSDVDTLSNKLWGEMFFNAKAKKWTKNGDENSTRTFVHFCLNPIFAVLAAAEENNITKIEKMMKAMGVTLETADTKLEGKPLFKRVMQRWMPAGIAIAKACEKFIPNPSVAQAKRFPVLTAAPPTDPSSLAIKACSKDGPMLFFTSKMTSQPSTPGRFFAIGRVFSGTASADKCYMLDADYKPPHAREEPEAEAEAAPAEADAEAEEDDEDAGEGAAEGPAVKAPAAPAAKVIALQQRRIQGTVICQTKAFTACMSVPSGNMCGLNGVDQFITKWVTVASDMNLFPCKAPVLNVSPVVRMSLNPKDVKELPKMAEGLKRLGRSCPLVEIALEDGGGYTVAACGEEHMRVLKHDLEHDFLPGIALAWGLPGIAYRETVTQESSVMCLSKSPNKHNRLYVKAEPLTEELCQAIEGHKVQPTQDMKTRAKILKTQHEWDPVDAVKVWGFGPAPESMGAPYGANMLVDQTRGLQYLNEIKESMNSGLLWATLQGPICEERVRGVRFNLLDCKLHADSIHRGMGQIQPPARRVFFASMMTADCRLVEPIFKAMIGAPGELRTSIMQAVSNCRGEFVQLDEQGTNVSVEAFIPVSEAIGANPFATVLSQKTNGKAFVSYAFSHWSTINTDPLNCDAKTAMPLTKAAEIMMSILKRKGKKMEPPCLTDYLDKL